DNDDDQDTHNDDDDFVHPKLSIHEEEAKEEESFDPIVLTPENSDDEVVGGVGACGTSEMVGMVGGGKVCAVNVRGATVVEA
nr:hypothetical protein [Tanacetum cinerariifolium]